MSTTTTQSLPIRCQCGQLRGVVTQISETTSMRSVCYCDDCQAYAHFLGRAPETLDAHGGTDIYPITPAQLQITQGGENLKCLRLAANGMYRWYAGCCQTPIGNIPASAKLPYVGLLHPIMDIAGTGRTRDEVLGPVHFRIQGRFGIGQLPPDTSPKAPVALMLSIIPFLLRAWTKHLAQPSPFRDATGAPKVTPYILSTEERAKLRAFCGPHPRQGQWANSSSSK